LQTDNEFSLKDYHTTVNFTDLLLISFDGSKCGKARQCHTIKNSIYSRS